MERGEGKGGGSYEEVRSREGVDAIGVKNPWGAPEVERRSRSMDR